MQKNEYLSRPKIYISLIFIMSTYQRGIKTQEEARQGSRSSQDPNTNSTSGVSYHIPN